jgi:hypothetical protein
MANVLCVYKKVQLQNASATERRSVTVSYDEKPGIQALAHYVCLPGPPDDAGVLLYRSVRLTPRPQRPVDRGAHLESKQGNRLQNQARIPRTNCKSSVASPSSRARSTVRPNFFAQFTPM